MRSGVPWSVKGIEPEAREAAKQAARRAGMTLGTWLNQVILDTSTDEVGTPSPPRDTAPETALQGAPAFYRSSPQAPSLDLAPITDAVRSLSQRLGENEQRLDTAIEAMSARLDDPARYQPALDSGTLERKIQQLTERLEAAEQGRSFGKRAEDAQAIKSLEKAVTAVVDHLESAEHQTDRRFDEIRATLSSLSRRMDDAEETSEREKARSQTEALYKSVHALAERMASMEKSVGTALSGLDTVQTRAIDAALKAINEKADADNQKSLITGLQDALVKMNARLDEAEKRQAETQQALFTQFQEGMSALGARLEEAQQDAAKKPETEAGAIVSEIMREVDQRFAEVSRRVEESEEQSRAVSGSVERALADMQASLASLAGKQAEPEKEEQSAPGTPDPAAPFAGLTAGAMPPPVEAAPLNAPPPDPARAPESSMPPPPPGMPQMPGAPEAEMRNPSPEGVSPVPPPHETYPGAQPGAHDIRAGQDFIAAARRAAQAAAQGEAPRGPVQESSPRYKNFDAGEDTDKRRKLIYVGAALLIAAAAVFAGRAWLGAGSEAPAPQTPPAQTSAEQTETAPATPEARLPDTAAAPDSANTGTQEQPEAAPAEGGEEAGPDAATDGPASAPPSASKTGDQAARDKAAEKPAAATPDDTTIMPRVAGTVPPAAPAPVAPVETAAPAPARQTLREAAASGNAAAQFEVGLRYARGEGVPQDFEQAAYWFEQAADQDLAIAQYRLATLYEKGRGVPQDFGQARALYDSAAGEGNVKAMHNLAVIYAEGKGTDQNFEEAARLFEAAAEHGLVDSQFNIAVLYERGLGLTADPARAYHWYAVAAKGGDKDAAAKRNEIGAALSASALADARLAAETWEPRKAAPVANGDLSSKVTWSGANAGTTGAAGGNASVARAQALLNELGYDPGPADGIMGPRTRDAISLFQSRAGVPATGKVTGELIGLLETYVR